MHVFHMEINPPSFTNCDIFAEIICGNLRKTDVIDSIESNFYFALFQTNEYVCAKLNIYLFLYVYLLIQYLIILILFVQNDSHNFVHLKFVKKGKMD